MGVFWVGSAYAQEGPTPTAVAIETASATPTLPSVSEMMTNVESTLQLLAKVDARWQQDTTLQDVGAQVAAVRATYVALQEANIEMPMDN